MEGSLELREALKDFDFAKGQRSMEGGLQGPPAGLKEPQEANRCERTNRDPG